MVQRVVHSIGQDDDCFACCVCFFQQIESRPHRVVVSRPGVAILDVADTILEELMVGGEIADDEEPSCECRYSNTVGRFERIYKLLRSLFDYLNLVLGAAAQVE